MGTPMDGIVEEEGRGGDHDSGAVSDDSSLTEIMAAVRRSSSATAKSMADAKAVEDDEAEEMPFAVAADTPPLLETAIPTRAGSSSNRGVSITSSRPAVKPTTSMVRAHFSEALSCYLKALKMLKCAVNASQRVAKEIDAFSNQRMTSSQLNHVNNLKKRCEVTPNWLENQFKGVLERADAANIEINKLPTIQTLAERNDCTPATSVE